MSKQSSIAKQIKHNYNKNVREMNRNPDKYTGNNKTAFTRKSNTFGPGDVFNTLAFMRSGTLFTELLDSDVNISVSGFCKKRDFIDSESCIPLLNKLYIKNNIHQTIIQTGRKIAIDGTDVCIPANKSDSKYTINSFGKEYILIHCTAVYDIDNDAFISCSFSSRKGGEGEITQATRLIESGVIHAGDIVIMDRGFCSLNLFRHCIEHGIYFVVRGKQNWLQDFYYIPHIEFEYTKTFHICTRADNKTKELYKKGLATRVHARDWDFEHSSYMKLRIISLKISDTLWEQLVTNLPETMYNGTEMKKLYHERWKIETAFRFLKYAHAGNTLHSKKINGAVLEFLAKMIRYNLCSAIIQHSLMTVGEMISKHGNPQKLNVSQAIYMCVRFLTDKISDFYDIEHEISKLRISVKNQKPQKRRQRCIVHQQNYLYRVA
jgi:hypothetical protein